MANGNGKKRLAQIGTAATVVATLAAIFAWGWNVSADRAKTREAVETRAEQVDDHEDRLRKVESRIERIDANVQWIRDRLATK